MDSPKILIFGQPFNNRQGGGITLTNLFKGWDKDRIAVAATGHVMKNISTEVCDQYYLLGNKEFRWRFPFYFIQKKFRSGLIEFSNNQVTGTTSRSNRLRRVLVNNYFYPLLEWVGLYHNSTKIRISHQFSEWLQVFKPEILYLQVYSYDSIRFARLLIETLKIPSVIHIMDDWPSTISTRGPFKKHWAKKIDNEFRKLLDEVTVFLSISDSMSIEYQRRYHKKFIPFHNPIDIEHWSVKQEKDYSVNPNHVKMLYSGRIGVGISDSLFEVAEAISVLNSTGFNIKFHIQSPASDNEIINKIQSYDCTVINPFVDYSSLPAIFSDADMLLIANDFDSKGIAFLRYSMPTKASEYMISGTPVLVYSHFETAVSQFFMENNCGCCVTEQSKKHLASSISKLICDTDYRKTLGTNAIRIATDLFNGERIRTEFRTLINELVITETPKS